MVERIHVCAGTEVVWSETLFQSLSLSKESIVTENTSLGFENDKNKTEINKVIKDVRSRLVHRYPTRFRREQVLYLVFSARDLRNTLTCSLVDLKLCLLQIHISLSDEMFEALFFYVYDQSNKSEQFVRDRSDSGSVLKISYDHFIRTVLTDTAVPYLLYPF